MYIKNQEKIFFFFEIGKKNVNLHRVKNSKSKVRQEAYVSLYIITLFEWPPMVIEYTTS